jgi:hypothetical protein
MSKQVIGFVLEGLRVSTVVRRTIGTDRKYARSELGPGRMSLGTHEPTKKTHTTVPILSEVIKIPNGLLGGIEGHVLEIPVGMPNSS